MKRTPRLTVVPNISRREGQMITQVREYDLITPLFGGGVTPGEVDPVTMIRGTEVRGHLRFWWRATRGGQYADSRALKAAEDKIWGAASLKENAKAGPSPVQIAVEVLNKGKEDSPFEVVPHKKHGRPQVQPRPGSRVPPYAAFPLQPPQQDAKIGMHTKSVQVGVTFAVRISYPTTIDNDEVEAALWAWETFGGIGARTRRGFGALCCTKIDQKKLLLPSANQIETNITEKLSVYLNGDTWPENLPHLPTQLDQNNHRITNKSDDAQQSWENLIEKLRAFRQYRGKSKFDASYWPEPNASRHYLGKNESDKRPKIYKFPRAKFGLPILFHFPQERFDVTLKGAGESDRLASPLILRPIACANGAVGLALRLQTPPLPPQGIVLDDGSREHGVDAGLTTNEARQIPVLNGKIDVIQAFLDTL